ncbi:hypothetical protein GCM10010218_24430 [Streptomyces mashuensis]|uniref:HTH gntR-type domain-containing protein n=1 Tax=Streptomyces mashuensis TaxID=33904 RepID=A0A919B3G0_9ACTN|nr:GntR family transcriptional regulator [Streptomyces mashuensis]GHF42404.1 hypothetical protein GCM10010218_24430 [Streptomyces mashuensis]
MSGSSPRGTYLRIAETLRQQLNAGEIEEALPSEAALMRAHAVSRTTVRRALQTLAAEGLIEALPGVGWQVQGGVATPSLVAQVRTELAVGGFQIGGTFHSEAALCERFGVSRTAVRKALGQLEGEGLLEPVHGKGRIVKALPPGAGNP